MSDGLDGSRKVLETTLTIEAKVKGFTAREILEQEAQRHIEAERKASVETWKDRWGWLYEPMCPNFRL